MDRDENPFVSLFIYLFFIFIFAFVVVTIVFNACRICSHLFQAHKNVNEDYEIELERMRPFALRNYDRTKYGRANATESSELTADEWVDKFNGR